MSFGPQPPVPPEPPTWPGQGPPTQPWPTANQQWPPANQQWPAESQQWPPANQPWPGMTQRGQGQEQYAVQPQPLQWEPLPLPGRPVQPMVAPKSPALSVLLSIFIPGLGSMVNDNVSTGVTILLLNILGLVLAIFLIGIPIMISTWVWGLVDAYQSAQRWNAAHGIIS
jgi:TM2 domain-containing membrane protein YozV